jgi:hypothetical protein
LSSQTTTKDSLYNFQALDQKQVKQLKKPSHTKACTHFLIMVAKQAGEAKGEKKRVLFFKRSQVEPRF